MAPAACTQTVKADDMQRSPESSALSSASSHASVVDLANTTSNIVLDPDSAREIREAPPAATPVFESATLSTDVSRTASRNGTPGNRTPRKKVAGDGGPSPSTKGHRRGLSQNEQFAQLHAIDASNVTSSPRRASSRIGHHEA